MAVRINREIFQVTQPGPDTEITIDNSDDLSLLPALVLHDLNSGVMFRLLASGTSLVIQSRPDSDSDWSDPATLTEFTSEGAEEGVFNEEYLSDFIDHLRLQRNSGVGVKFKELLTEYIL